MSESRRLSASSDEPSSPLFSPDSASPLILVAEDTLDAPLGFSSDDDDEQAFGISFDGRLASSPPLSSSTIFLYLLAPYLKLGAMCLPGDSLPLHFTIPSIVLFAVLSALSRHILYLLSRYLRKADFEDLILDAFARSRGKERQRELLRTVVRCSTGGLRMLMATVYLRECQHIVLPLLPETLIVPSWLIITIGFALCTVPLYAAQSLASKRIVYATWTSVVTYILWLGCIAYAHSRGVPHLNQYRDHLGKLWQGTTKSAFAFATSSTLCLYASFKGTVHPVSTKSSKHRSFKSLSALSTAVAIALIIPLAFLLRYPNKPMQEKLGVSLQHLVAFFNVTTLLLAVPAVLITAPPIPLPAVIRRSGLSKTVIFLTAFLLSLVPASISGILSDLLLVATLSGTYFIPALLHITTHQFKRPLSIVIPPHTESCTPERSNSPSPRDELLQRKERALQKRQKMKRVVWDVGVWLLLVPVGGGGFVWAVGRIVGSW